MPRIKKFIRATSIPGFAIALLLATGVAGAYDKAGHFYSIHIALIDAGVEAKDAAIIELCAQLPDQNHQLDAVSLYAASIGRSPFAWIKWAVRDKVDSPEVRKMITVQQLQHALTGGNAELVQKTAKTIVNQLAAAVHAPGTAGRASSLCALGFSLHLFGDSFAHQQMDIHPDRMYGTGSGHARDFHYPDLPLCAKYNPPRSAQRCQIADIERFARWRGYFGSVRGILSQYPNLSRTPRDTDAWAAGIAKRVLALKGTSDSNKWNERRMRAELAMPHAIEKLEQFFDENDNKATCEEVIRAAHASGAPLEASGDFACRNAWGAFAAEVRRQYRAAGPDIREKMDLDFEGKVYLDPL